MCFICISALKAEVAASVHTLFRRTKTQKYKMVCPTLPFAAKVNGKEAQSLDCSLLICTLRQMCYVFFKKTVQKA